MERTKRGYVFGIIAILCAMLLTTCDDDFFDRAAEIEFALKPWNQRLTATPLDQLLKRNDISSFSFHDRMRIKHVIIRAINDRNFSSKSDRWVDDNKMHFFRINLGPIYKKKRAECRGYLFTIITTERDGLAFHWEGTGTLCRAHQKSHMWRDMETK